MANVKVAVYKEEFRFNKYDEALDLYDDHQHSAVPEELLLAHRDALLEVQKTSRAIYEAAKANNPKFKLTW